MSLIVCSLLKSARISSALPLARTFRSIKFYTPQIHALSSRRKAEGKPGETEFTAHHEPFRVTTDKCGLISAAFIR